MAGCISETEMKSILSRTPKYADIDTFVETGTFRAETISKMSNIFSCCHTIELSRELHEKAKKTYASSGIVFHLGDSTEILEKLVKEINQPVVFFLDAHWCGRESAKGAVDVPLLREVQLIAERPYNDLLIIDDFRLFSTNINEDWQDVSVSSVLQILNKKIPRWKRIIPRMSYFVKNDRMIIPL